MSVIRGKAAISFTAGTELKVVDVKFDPPKAGEVRIKIIATGICHSDINVIKGYECGGKREEKIKRPVILGHEAAGIVESVGPGVSSVTPGDHVIALWLPQCNTCTVCKYKPMSNVCEKLDYDTAYVRDDGTSRIHLLSDDTPAYTMLGTGTFAEYIILEERNVCKLSKEIPFDHACIFGCAVGTGYGSARNIARVDKGGVCAVWGLGAIGLSTIMGCKAAGASRIIAVDINPNKFQMAVDFGATECVNPGETEDIVEYLSQDGGIDYAFECTGVPTCMKQAQSTLASCGMLVIVGLQPTDTILTTDVKDLVKGQTICGGFFGKYKPRDGIEIISKEFMAGRLDCSKLITHRLTLDEINIGVQLLVEGRSVRTIIEM